MGPSMSRASQFQKRAQTKKIQVSKRRLESQRALSLNKLPTSTKVTKQYSVPKTIRQSVKDERNSLGQLLQKQVKQGISTQSQYQNIEMITKQPPRTSFKSPIIMPSPSIYKNQYNLIKPQAFPPLKTYNKFQQQQKNSQIKSRQLIKNIQIKSPISSLILNQSSSEGLSGHKTIIVQDKEYKIDIDRFKEVKTGIRKSNINSMVQYSQKQVNHNLQPNQHQIVNNHKKTIDNHQKTIDNPTINNTTVYFTDTKANINTNYNKYINNSNSNNNNFIINTNSNNITNINTHNNNFIRHELKQNYSHKKRYVVESASMSIGNLGLVSFDGRNKVLQIHKKLDNSSRIPQNNNKKISQYSVNSSNNNQYNSISNQQKPKRLLKASKIAPLTYQNIRKVQQQYYEQKHAISNKNLKNQQTNEKNQFNNSLSNQSLNRSKSLSSNKSVKIIKIVRK